MVRIRSGFLIVFGVLAFLGNGVTRAQRFYPDDPIQEGPKPVPVREIERVDIYAMFDYLYQSSRQKPQTLLLQWASTRSGEVFDSAWFTNRHGRTRMTVEALKRGAGNENAPQPPFVIVGAKPEGITPGFRMKDAKGRLYFVKPDPIGIPELASGAEVIGSKFFHAIGYNTPENYIVRIRKSDLTIGEGAMVTGDDRISREMLADDLVDILEKVSLLPDGSFRAVASLAIPGKDLGPFRYEGTRSDDPNDLIPHEHRRDLRGLFVFCCLAESTRMPKPPIPSTHLSRKMGSLSSVTI